MSLYFDEEHKMFRQMVRQFVEKEIEPHVEEWEAQRIWPARALLKKMGNLGLLGLSYPEQYGGAGLDYWYNLILHEELGRCGCGGVPMGIGVHTDMATPALEQFGSEELKQRFLVPAISGDMCAAIAVSEPDAGSDVAAIRTRAEPDGDMYVINGSKMWITNGTQADFIVLLARTAAGQGYRGMSLIVVPTGTPGFSVGRKLEKLGMHSSDTANPLLRQPARAAVLPYRRGGRGLPAPDAAVPKGAAGRLGDGAGRRRARDRDHHQVHQGAPGLRQAADREPVDPLQAGRAAGRGRGAPPAELPLHAPDDRRPGRHQRGLDGQA